MRDLSKAQSIKSMIHTMFIYSFRIHLWYVQLLKQIDSWFKNFLWSGDIYTRKVCTISWAKTSLPFEEGGLASRTATILNNSSIFNLTWKIISSGETWDVQCRARFLRNKIHVSHHIKSSIWPGIKQHFQEVMNNSISLIGNGQGIRF
jgi:hypothetical protein